MSNNADNNKVVHFLLLFFLGFIGSFIINHTSLKYNGWKCRTCANFFLGIITFGIYSLVVAICSLVFKNDAERNIGYFKENA